MVLHALPARILETKAGMWVILPEIISQRVVVCMGAEVARYLSPGLAVNTSM